ncbi:hypothetical protein FHR33_000504 [Nonomuraea dietziae]|uniref:Uncharacterized protein n=1 Tax=Nonomuraea dietziae TaxID=65515 RepID=A0A7W5YP39_9ACTN|nr:hypothetical protein [Nonomuraea dietziae]
MFLEQMIDDRLRDAQQISVRGIQALGRGFGDGGEDTADRTLSSAFEKALEQTAHCHQLETADVQTDYADERRGLGFLLQNEYPHIVQPQFGGQHRAGRPAPGDDHVEHEGRAIGPGGRRPDSGDVAHGEVALDRTVRRRLGGELLRVHRCCLSGVPCCRGAPGDTYVNRPTVTVGGAPTSIQRSWVSPPQAVSQSTASYKPEHHTVQSFPSHTVDALRGRPDLGGRCPDEPPAKRRDGAVRAWPGWTTAGWRCSRRSR